MPERQVYICDKTESLGVGPKTPVCNRDVGEKPVEITFSYSVNGVPVAWVEPRQFCSITHANFWLKRQRVHDLGKQPSADFSKSEP